MTGDGNKRAVRLGERIREELMELFLRGDVHDPAVAGAVVARVQVTGDLRIARVYIRHQNPDLDEDQRKALLAGLGRARGFMRRAVGQRIELRYNPELEFLWDTGADHALTVETILAEIAAENARKDSGES